MTCARFMLLSIGLIGFAECSPGSRYVPLRLTGFNRDTIVESTADGPLSDYAESFDLTYTQNDINNTAFYEEGFRLAGEVVDRGLPVGGRVVSLAGEVPFQLADYTSHNTLRVNVNDTETLTLVSDDKKAYKSLVVLAASSNAFGDALADVTIVFADGSEHTAAITAPDWFGGESNVAVSNVGRVSLHSSVLSAGGENPRLYQTVVTIPEELSDQPIDSLRFTWSSAGFLQVMAVTGELQISEEDVLTTSEVSTTTTACHCVAVEPVKCCCKRPRLARLRCIRRRCR